MAATKKVKKDVKNVKQDRSHFIAFVAVIAFLVVTCSVLTWGLYKQADVISKYQLLELIDNQACRYLDNQPAVNGSFNLNTNASVDSPKLVYKCLTGETVATQVIQGKSVPQFESGASVAYFSTNQEAIKYAEEKLNSLRYWGVDEQGQKNNIPQTSEFTFIVAEGDKPYFDAYTVKANAVLRVSLPCTTADASTCNTEATNVLRRELKGINVL